MFLPVQTLRGHLERGIHTKATDICRLWRQRGHVVSVSESQSGGPRFEIHSDHYMDLFLGSPELES